MNILKWTTISKVSLAPMDDEAQLIQTAKTNPSAFAPIYERYVGRVYAYCLKRTGNAQDAEDLTSQVFVKILKSLHTYQSGGLFSAWLFRIAHNAVYDFHQGQHVSIDIDDLEIAGISPPDPLEKEEDLQLINCLVAKLPRHQQELLILSLQAGLTSEEIGQILGKRAGTVRVQLHRIIQHLREQYHQFQGGDV